MTSTMQTDEYSDFSITLSTFFLKQIGLWIPRSVMEGRRMKFTLCYTVWTMLLASFFEVRDLYFSWNNYSAFLYVCSNLLSIILVVIKTMVLIVHRTAFIELILYMRKHYWNAKYDDEELKIIAQSRRTCILFISLVTFTGHCAIICYLLTPILENIGKNDTERILPFNMWLDAPLWMTPYYEMMFVVQILTLYPIGVCYFSFDNFLCILNVHVAGQFRILQKRLTKLCNLEEEMRRHNGNIDLIDYANESYMKLRRCIQQHQDIIDYCRRLEDVFKLIVFGQVLIFSLLICLFGYQVTLEDSSIAKRCIFVFLLTGSSSLLLMFTYSCHGLIEQSDNVGIAAYSAPWTHIPMSKAGKMVRYDLILIMLRSKRTCCLTAYGFFPVSLETYTSIFSTAVSYFTLLRQSGEDSVEN